ncbi:hypothetical protein ruthe_02755 [Rubellimicrobium thermophilum DSM 16684]|uniref:Uncharacterized protein n=1 Tax=Rubellimicrobium thermophilum DSM 16684 TaxID=1123069 RepID=S9QU29_9RHOB|nr:hypothetical protein [Rubellimicrobium thermophilum]EPX83138.1 hypothetical protein ruthe_02755 [Rubellimicrobium thermophilum DSM 16684]
MTDILRLALPLTTWLAAFSAVYGLHGLVCSPRWAQAGLGPETGRPVLLLAAGLAIGLQIALLLALRRSRLAAPSPLIRRITTMLAVSALVATVWTLTPVTATTTCH